MHDPSDVLRFPLLIYFFAGVHICMIKQIRTRLIQHRMFWSERIHIVDSHHLRLVHYNDVIMSTMASQITGVLIVYPTVYSGADQRKHQSSASPAFVRGIHRRPMNSPHKKPVTQKMFPFDDVTMWNIIIIDVIPVSINFPVYEYPRSPGNQNC